MAEGMVTVAALEGTCPDCGETWMRQVVAGEDPTVDPAGWTRSERCPGCGALIEYTFPPASEEAGRG